MKKSTFEVRYENGASNILEADDFGEAARISHNALLNCLPPPMRTPGILVRTTIVRNLNFHACCICGIKLLQPLVITPPTGVAVQICTPCASIVAQALCKEVAEGILSGGNIPSQD